MLKERYRQFRRFLSPWKWKLQNSGTLRKLGLHECKNYSDVIQTSSDVQEILSIAKHEAHRLEKAFYAGYYDNPEKLKSYQRSHRNLGQAIETLTKTWPDQGRPDIAWLKHVHASFTEMDQFLSEGRGEDLTFIPEKIREYEAFAKTRRSTRTWASHSYSDDELMEFGKQLIRCARWAPCSGNRQPWYFHILVKPEDKKLLRGIKEEHCVNAPLVIFVGIRKNHYGAIGSKEYGIYIDGAAAAMQMIMAAHSAGWGSCWNHFCYDLVYSRQKNVKIFQRFYQRCHIPKEVEPIALVAFGPPAFVSPVPERPPVEVLCPQFQTEKEDV